jgi:hypothetical protein
MRGKYLCSDKFFKNLKIINMKKTILLIATIAFTVNLSAQEDMDLRDRIQFGLKGGINYSNVYDAAAEEFEADFKIGFVGGAFLTIPMGKLLGIQPEVLFSQKGYSASGTVLTIPYEYTHTASFIDIPLMLAIRPTSFLTVLAGPQYSFLIEQEDEFASGSFAQDEDFELDKNVFGFLGGVDIKIDKVVLGARVGWDIQENNGDGTTTKPRYKNTWIQATIGFRF